MSFVIAPKIVWDISPVDQYGNYLSHFLSFDDVGNIITCSDVVVGRISAGTGSIIEYGYNIEVSSDYHFQNLSQAANGQIAYMTFYSYGLLNSNSLLPISSDDANFANNKTSWIVYDGSYIFYQTSNGYLNYVLLPSSANAIYSIVPFGSAFLNAFATVNTSISDTIIVDNILYFRNGGLYAYNLKTGTLKTNLENVAGFCFSGDGNIVVSYTDSNSNKMLAFVNSLTLSIMNQVPTSFTADLLVKVGWVYWGVIQTGNNTTGFSSAIISFDAYGIARGSIGLTNQPISSLQYNSGFLYATNGVPIIKIDPGVPHLPPVLKNPSDPAGTVKNMTLNGYLNWRR